MKRTRNIKTVPKLRDPGKAHSEVYLVTNIASSLKAVYLTNPDSEKTHIARVKEEDINKFADIMFEGRLIVKTTSRTSEKYFTFDNELIASVPKVFPKRKAAFTKCGNYTSDWS